ncbi:hypothetical protein D3C72_2487740 [compost metagenome]
MLELTAAALLIDRARRLDAVRARFEHLKQLGVAELLLQLQHLNPRFLAGESPMYKKGKAVHTAYPFSVMT